MNTDNHITYITDPMETLAHAKSKQTRRRGSQLVLVCATVEELTRQAAELFVAKAQQAIAVNGHFSVALSGGSTPRSLYAHLAEPDVASRIHWETVHLFWGDERCVPPEHTDSNFRMVSETLLEHIAIPAQNIHRIQGELQPSEASAQYEHELYDFFEGTPRFDLILLGLGDDGHTASLFPFSPALQEQTRWVVAVSHETSPSPLVSRVTLTLPVINNAQNIVFLVSGARKASRLAEILNAPAKFHELPAQAVRPNDGERLWLIDKAAAVDLNRETK